MHAIAARAHVALLCLAGALSAQSSDLNLQFATFDPARGEPTMPADLRADAAMRLWIVQFDSAPTDADRAALRAFDARICSYLPHDAYVVRLPAGAGARIAEAPGVRFAGAYHPAYRIEPALIDAYTNRALRGGDRLRCNVVVTDKQRDKPALIANLRALGGTIEHAHPGSILVEVSLTLDQLARAARLDQVLWIDRAGVPELDMIHARAQGGGQAVEKLGGYRGQGIRGHIYEGLEATHPDFGTTPIAVLSCNTPDRHGHCTAGIIAGNGTSDPLARGMAPDARMFFTNYNCVEAGVSRWQVVERLVNKHQVMFTSASWGNTRTLTYTSVSADADDIVFSHDIPWTQSQSNSGSQWSRPQAWGKNVISVGGLWHNDNADPSDDSWAGGSSSASRGPALDGRNKPDLCAYYDNIHTSDLTGTAGYSEGASYLRFNGTSGATPIVAGHNAIALQMYTDGILGNGQRVPGGTRFQNRPHFTTLKALQIANARQYPFDINSSDNRREHQGWGFPDLRSMWDNRGAHVIIDETDVLAQGEGTRWTVDIAPGRGELKVCMTFADPAGNPAATLARVNDLTLRVTAPNGDTYWGNWGLTQGNHSALGGGADTIDTVENVFVANPTAGTWTVDVFADEVLMDAHVETAAVDADYALVINGASLIGSVPLVHGSYDTYGAGCVGTAPGPGPGCITQNEGLPRLQIRTAVPKFALEINPTEPITITGYELLTLGNYGPVTAGTSLYADQNGLPGAELTTGTMAVGTTEGWYSTTFANPVTVLPGQRVHLGFDTGGQTIGMSIVQGTTYSPYSLRASPLSPWNGPFLAAWAFRVHCASGPTRPALFSTDPQAPRLGRDFDLQLAGTLPGTAVALTVGASDSAWAGGALPFPLAAIGAPGCTMLTSLEAFLPAVANGSGRSTFRLAIPGSPSLLGQTTYHQAWVLDPAANVPGLVTSNAARLTIGH